MNFIIKPYQSVNNYVFGETIAQVAKKNGKPEVTEHDKIMNNILEKRLECDLTYEKKKLVYVDIFKDATPIVEGINIYEEGSIEKLKLIDSDFFIGKRKIIFRSLGILVGGFSIKKIPEKRLVTVFDKSMLEGSEFIVNSD
jgi:hypothetical protein